MNGIRVRDYPRFHDAFLFFSEEQLCLSPFSVSKIKSDYLGISQEFDQRNVGELLFAKEAWKGRSCVI